MKSKTIINLVAKHQEKISDWYRDSEGYWINLRPGWQMAEFTETHTVHGVTARETISDFRHVCPCNCTQCKRTLRRLRATEGSKP